MHNTKQMRHNRLLSVGATMTIVALSFFGAQTAFAAITGELDLGDRGSEVTELQTYLSTDANIYPSNLVTGYFGQLTKAGIERFQTREGIVSSGTSITTGYGRVGPKTRAAINVKLAGGVVQTGDVYAPSIQTVNVTAGVTNATVYWTASESAFGKVYYSTSPIRISNIFDVRGVFSGEPVVSGTLATYDTTPRASHTVNIGGLAANTTYYYVVVAHDAAKNISISLPASFRTN